MNDQDQRNVAGPALQRAANEINHALQMINDSIQATFNRLVGDLKRIWPDPVMGNVIEGPTDITPTEEEKK